MPSKRGRTALIFIVFGASGSGKSTLMTQIEAMSEGWSYHLKGTDREGRQYDGDEIICVSEVLESEYDYIYRAYGHSYGIQKRQIDGALARGEHHFIICNDVATIEAIRQDYRGRVRTIFLCFDAPRETLEGIQRARRISDDEIELRLTKIEVLNRLFCENASLFDGVVVNKLGAPPERMLYQLRRIVSELGSEAESEAVGPQSELTIADLVRQLKEQLLTRAQRMGVVEQEDYLFVLMAMSSGDPLLDDCLAAVKRAASRLQLRAERVDDIAHSEQITDKVLGSIQCAQYVVADLTHERPNVYYELGYAHAFGKTTLLTAREGTALHFDVRNYPVIFYNNASALEDKLCEQLSRFQRAATER